MKCPRISQNKTWELQLQQFTWQTDSALLLFMNTPHTRPHNNFRCLSHNRLPLHSGTISLCLCSMYNCFLSVTSGFHDKVNEKSTLLCYYDAHSAILLLTFQDNIAVPSLGVKNPKHMISPICCPETLVRNYQYMLHSNTGERSSRLLLKSQLTPHKEHTLFGSKNSLSNLSS